MEILQIVLTAATGSGVTAIILAILQRKWTKDDKRDAIVDALKVLLIDRVRYLGQKYISDGSACRTGKRWTRCTRRTNPLAATDT